MNSWEVVVSVNNEYRHPWAIMARARHDDERRRQAAAVRYAVGLMMIKIALWYIPLLYDAVCDDIGAGVQKGDTTPREGFPDDI